MILLLLGFVFSISQSASAYTQDDFVLQLLSSHDFFEKERIGVQIKRIEMNGDRDHYANWGWDFGAELGRTHKNKLKHDYTSSTDYARKTTQQVRKISSDLSKKFFSNGSELTFSFDRSLPIKDEEMHDKNDYQKDKNTTEYLNDMSVSWSLPLLKNKNGIIDQKTYDMAVLDYEDERLVLAEAQEDFIEDKMSEFIDWVAYKWKIKVVDNSLLTLLESQEYATKVSLRDADTFARAIDKNKRLLLSFRSKLKAQNILLLGSIDTLDFANNPPTLEQNFQVNLVKNIELHSQYKVRDLMRIKLEMLKNDRYISSYKNEKMADLDFTISASRDDNKGNYTSYSKSSEIQYEAKLIFSYSLSGDIGNQVYLDKYQLKTRQLELKFNSKLNDIASSANKVDTDIKQGRVQLALIEQQLKLFKLNEEFKLYLKGDGEARFVIAEQNDYQDLLLERIAVLIDLYTNKLMYDSLLDRLLPLKL